jgi:YebC/PmpR family DNA-binding regulatory protein
MSGHSKWSQIKRQKGAADIKRGAIFSKLTNAIILSARHGGDSEANFQLKMAVEKAREASMPKENIDRAIKRGTGELAGARLEEILYEAIGPGGIGILIEAATDNRNRTNSEIKNILANFSGKLTGSGAVSYQFEKMGKFLISLTGQNQDELELQVIDAGAQDLEEQEESLAVYTKPNELEMVKKNLESQGINIKEAALIWEPKNLITIGDKVQAERILKLMERLEELDGVTVVYSNFDLPKELL